MKPSSNQVNGNHQKEGNKREDKKSINTRWNSTVFFQIGLVITLLASVYAMELKVGDGGPVKYVDRATSVEDPASFTFVVEKITPVAPPKKTIAKKVTPIDPPKRLTTKVKVVDNDALVPETKVTLAPPVMDDQPVVKAPPVVAPPVDTKPVSAIAVEFAPVFPGCESLNNNGARIDCMSSKISQFVVRKFDTTVADEDTFGTQKIYVQFTINKNGEVADVKAKSKDKNLQKEAQRVISKLPTMTPGKQGNNNVDVIYMVPITFQIQN